MSAAKAKKSQKPATKAKKAPAKKVAAKATAAKAKVAATAETVEKKKKPLPTPAKRPESSRPPEMIASGPEGEMDDDLFEMGDESGAMGGGAGLSAMGGKPPMEAANASASFKNFRHHSDMENFYRFIYDNDLRFEALHIIDEMMADKQRRKALKTRSEKIN